MAPDGDREHGREETLVAYALGEVSGRRRRRLEKGLAGSPEGLAALGEIRRLLEATHALKDPPLPEELRDRLLARFRASVGEAAAARTENGKRVGGATSLMGVLALQWEYFRFRLRTSAGFRVLTVATAVALHALILALVAGITLVTIRQHRPVTDIWFEVPGDETTASQDVGAVLPRPPSDPIRAEPEPIVLPDLEERDAVDLTPAIPGRSAMRESPWDRLPPGRDDRLRLARWFLFARLPGERRDDLLRHLGGSAATEAAVKRGIGWLAHNQSPDGRWDAERFGGYRRYDLGVTSLALLALLGDGNAGRRGPWAETVHRGVEYIVRQQSPRGLLGPEGDPPALPMYLYNHTIATSALIECYLMNPGRHELEAPIEAALASLLEAQNDDGGWRNTRAAGSSDSSVTSWVLGTLALARRAGLLAGHDEVFERALERLASLTSPAGRTGYRRKPAGGGGSLRATAAAFAARVRAGRRDSTSRAQAGLLAREAPSDASPGRDPLAAFLLSEAMFQIGGPPWQGWSARLAAALPESQERDGSWAPRGPYGPAGGRVAATALATLTLEVYYRYPRFQD